MVVQIYSSNLESTKDHTHTFTHTKSFVKENTNKMMTAAARRGDGRGGGKEKVSAMGG